MTLFMVDGVVGDPSTVDPRLIGMGLSPHQAVSVARQNPSVPNAFLAPWNFDLVIFFHRLWAPIRVQVHFFHDCQLAHSSPSTTPTTNPSRSHQRQAKPTAIGPRPPRQRQETRRLIVGEPLRLVTTRPCWPCKIDTARQNPARYHATLCSTTCTDNQHGLEAHRQGHSPRQHEQKQKHGNTATRQNPARCTPLCSTHVH